MNELLGKCNRKLMNRDYHLLWMQEIRSHGNTRAFPDWSCIAIALIKNKRKKEKYQQCEKTREKISQIGKEYRTKNKDLVAAKKREWQLSLDKEKRKISNQKWYSKNQIQIQQKARIKRQSRAYKDKRNKWEREKVKTDKSFRIMKNLRRGIASICSRQRCIKQSRTLDLLGIDANKFLKYIESKFSKKMNWGNYGTYWHIDHIIPCASFDHSDPKQVATCWHWTNLRPLKASENFRKSAKMTDPQIMFKIEA